MKKIPPQIELARFMAGDTGFEIACTDGYIPTDTERVIENLLSKSEEPKFTIEEIASAIVLLSSRQDKGWLVMYYLVDLVFWERKNHRKLLTSMDHQTIVQNLLKWNNTWEVDHSWGGSQFPNGLWGDVCRLHRSLCTKYGLCLLKEDEL